MDEKLKRPEFKKKLTALILSALVLILNDILELGISADTLTWLAGLVGTYMLGQGMADIGKERAIIQAKSGMAEHMEIDIDVDSRVPGLGSASVPGLAAAGDAFKGRSFG